MKYVPIPALPRDTIIAGVVSGVPETMAKAILSAALYQPDRVWVEGLVADGLGHSAAEVRRAAAMAAGHLARIHGALDVVRLMPMLNALRDDPQTSGAAGDALSDIAMFVAGSAST